MIIYNPHNDEIIAERMALAKELLGQIPTKYCFITGSFLYKEKYNDIDIFVVTRSKKKITIDNKKAKITLIDFNEMHSLFYHSLTRSYISKSTLPTRQLKVTLSDYWHVINEAIPTILNQKNKFHKDVRFLILYTEYFKTGKILDTFELNERIEKIKDYNEILKYIKMEVPRIMMNKMKKSYIKRFFYTQAGFYKDLLNYKAQNFLYNLTHLITRGIANG